MIPLATRLGKNLILSLGFGFILTGFGMFNFICAEKIQAWSEKFTPPKNWARRIIHLLQCLVSVLIIFYGILYWLSIIAPLIRDLAFNQMLQLLVFIFYAMIIIVPFYIFRKKLFRKINVKNN
jgi:uncharacterized membrane protein YidH (DUF202 family)